MCEPFCGTLLYYTFKRGVASDKKNIAREADAPDELIEEIAARMVAEDDVRAGRVRELADELVQLVSAGHHHYVSVTERSTQLDAARRSEFPKCAS